MRPSLFAFAFAAGCSSQPPVDPMTLMDPDPRIAAANFLDAEAGDRPAVDPTRLEDALDEIAARYPAEAKDVYESIAEARYLRKRADRVAAFRRLSMSFRRAAETDAGTATMYVSPGDAAAAD